MQGLASGRATGMAEAVSTLSDDLAGWPYNPGTLGTLTAPQISGTFSRGLAADRLSIVSYGHPTRLGTFAGAIAYYNGGKEELAASDGSLYSVQLQRDALGSISMRTMSGAESRSKREVHPVRVGGGRERQRLRRGLRRGRQVPFIELLHRRRFEEPRPEAEIPRGAMPSLWK